MREVKPRSTGFEIETELTAEAVARGYRVIEVPVPYYPRIEGTKSKLLAFRDGRRILRAMIVPQSVRLGPGDRSGWSVASGYLGSRYWPGRAAFLLIAGTMLGGGPGAPAGGAGSRGS